MNVSGPYYDVVRTIPFANLMWQADRWINLVGGTFYTNQNQGVTTGNGASDTLYCIISNNPDGLGLPAGEYTWSNPDGNNVAFGTSAGGEQIKAFGTTTSGSFSLSAGSPLFVSVKGNATNTAGTRTGGLQIILPGHAASWAAGDYFNSDWIAYQQGLSVQSVRVMDWLAANLSTATDWANRGVITKITLNTVDVGMPWEVIIALANKLAKPAHIVIPPRVTDSYVTSLASLFNSTYSPTNLLVEYTNEGWNYLNEFSLAYQWVSHLTFTKYTVSLDPTTGLFTKTAHGWANDRRIRTFIDTTGRSVNYGNEAGIYEAAWGPTSWYLKSISANTFELWNAAGGTGTKLTMAGTGITQLILVDENEAGKTADNNGNYATRAKQIWDIFDAAMGSSRVKAVMGSQSANTSITSARMAVSAAATRADYLATAPYYNSIVMGGEIARTSNTFTPKLWASDLGVALGYFGVYAQGSTPTKYEVRNGTGTGYVDHSSWSLTYGARVSAPVSISNGSPAVVTWDTTAPAANSVVVFATTGALPTGLIAGDTYYVKSPSGNTFNVSSSAGGAAINTSSAGSGSHTATAYYSASDFIPGAATTVVDGVNYTIFYVVEDSEGCTWMWSQDVAAANVTDTVSVLDDEANQTARALQSLDAGTFHNVLDTAAAHMAIAEAANPSIQLMAYECWSHENYSMPSAIGTWHESWMGTAGHATVGTRYLNQMAAAGYQYAEIYRDIAGSGPWCLGNNTTDTSDPRYQAVAAFGGGVAVRTPVNLSAVNGTRITSAPGSYPYSAHVFADAGLTYTILNDDRANWDMSGATLRLLNSTGINYAVSGTETLLMHATDGYTVSNFTFTIPTGPAAWNDTFTDAQWAFNSVTDSDNAAMNPSTGNALSKTGTGATISGGYWDPAGATSYSSSSGMASAVSDISSTPWLAAVTLNKDNQSATDVEIFQFGGFPYLQGYIGGDGFFYMRLAGGGDDTYHQAGTWTAANKVFWLYHDGNGASAKVYYGTNQTDSTSGAGTTRATTSASFGQTVSFPARDAKFGSSVFIQRAGLTRTQALAIVQAIQNVHSI